jgi:hypothetical protein
MTAAYIMSYIFYAVGRIKAVAAAGVCRGLSTRA